MSRGINCSILAEKFELFAERAETESHSDLIFGGGIDYLIARLDKDLITGAFDFSNGLIDIIREQSQMADSAESVFSVSIGKNLDKTVACVDHQAVRPSAADLKSQNVYVKLFNSAELIFSSAFHGYVMNSLDHNDVRVSF